MARFTCESDCMNAGQSLNASYLSPYLDSLGGSKFTNGANFAVVGSSTLPKYVPFSLNIQVMQFLHFKARSLELVNAGNVLVHCFFSSIHGILHIKLTGVCEVIHLPDETSYRMDCSMLHELFTPEYDKL